MAPSDHRGTGAMRLHTSQPRALPILRKKYTIDQIGEILYINQEKYICTRNKSIRHYNLIEMALPKKCVVQCKYVEGSDFVFRVSFFWSSVK